MADNNILFFNDGQGHIRQVPANQVNIFKKYFPKATPADEEKLSAIESKRAAEAEQREGKKITAPKIRTIDADNIFKAEISLGESKTLPEVAEETYYTHKQDPEIAFSAKYGAYKENPQLFRDRDKRADETELTDLAKQRYKQETKSKRKAEMESLQDFLANTPSGREFVEYEKQEKEALEQFGKQLNEEIGKLEKEIKEKATARQKLLERPVEGTRYGVPLAWLSKEEKEKISAQKAKDAQEADKIATADDIELANKNLQELKNLQAAVKDKDRNFISQFFREAGRRLPESLYNIGTMGLADLTEGLSPKQGGELTRQSEELLGQYASLHQADRTIAQDIARGTTESLEFMAQFAGTGGIVGGVSKGIGKTILKEGIKKAATKGAKKVIKIAGKEIAESLLQTAIMPSTIAMSIEKNAQEPGSFLDAFSKSYLSNLVEVMSERVGEFIPGLKIKGLPQSIQKLQKVTGIQGWFAELVEEQFATIGHAILGDGQGEWSDLIDPRQQLITAGVVGVMQIPYVSITTGGYAAAKFNNAKQKRSINKAYVKNVENMKNVFGDEAEHVQKWINGVVEQANSSEDNTAMIPALILSVAQSEEFDEKQADAITKYTLSYLAKSGMEKGKAEQIQEAQQEAQEIAQEAINPETKSVILAKVPGMTEPTLIEGDIVLHEDGTIDAHKSGEIFYTDTDGNRKVIDPKFVEIVENVPADQAIEELTAAKTAEVINRQANDEVRPYEIGEVVRFSPDGNVSLIGKIQEIDEEGNYQVVVEGVPTPVSIEPRMIIEEENLRGVDNGVTVDYRDENGNIVTGTVDDASIRNHGVIVVDGKEVRNEDVIGVHQEGVTQPQEADKMTQEAPESESVSPDKIQQNVRETAETVAESQITPEQQAEAEKQQFMQSLPIVEEGKNKGRIDQSRMTPEQNIKYFEYQYGKEKAVEAARKMADNLKARIKKEQAKLDADPFNIAQNELVDSLTKQQKAYQDYAFEAMQEKTEKNIEELPKSSVLEERKKRKEEIQEEEASKTGTVSQSIKEKWDAAEKIEGIEDVITLANGEKIPGRYVLTTADAPSPSHDVDRNFAKTKGFPVNEQGKTVNDRDYEADEHAQLLVQQRANKYDERAIQTPVVVSKDGIVLSGNDRTMAGKIAARNGTDKAYVDYITKYADRWGFTPQMIKSFDHPRIVFVPDVELPYNTATFAKFNAEEKKTQSSLESAIKASKSLSKDVIIPLANIIDEFEKLNDFYANKQATKTAIQMLLQNNVIQPNEVPRLMDGELLSTEGKSFLETVMLASVLKEQALREIDTMRSVRQSLMRIMPQLISNAALRDYTLTSELNNAIHLLYEAKQTGSKVKLQLMQGSIFDAPASQIYKETEKLLAVMLENTKDTEIRAIFEAYNKEASAVESGQIDMFEGILSKPDLLSLILNKYGQQTERARQDESVVKGDGKGERDRSGRGESEREGQQPGEQSTGKGTKQQEIKEPNDYIRRTVDKWVDLYEKGEYEEIFDDDIFNNVYANKHIIKPFEERIGITIPDISTEKAKKDFIKSLKEKFVKPETDSLKRNQYEIIRQSNPIRDDIHTGIRSEADILTAEEAFTPSIDENEDVTPDFTVSDMKEALKSGLITVHSSYPIENGVFVTPSKMEAQSYAGKNKVYSKTVPLSNVAWIDAIEGQYTEIEHEKEETTRSKLEKEADDALNEFLDAFNDLYSKNIGIVENTAEKQARMLIAGTKMVGAYTKLGVYRFADLVNSIAKKGIEITEDLLSALKKSYGAFAAENDIDELDDMRTVRSFKLEDINKEEKQSDKNKRDEQRARNTAAIELETEAIESASKAVEYKSKNVGSDQQSAGEVKEETDELIGKVEEQLQKIDLRLQNLQMTGKRYSTEGIARDYPVSILSKGIIKKDATKFVDAIKKLTGLQYDTNKKGKTEKVSVNIAPSGGNISFFLWSNVDPELGVYVSIPVESFENTEYDEYFVPKEGNILWRLTAKKNKYTGFKNRWVNADITAGELSKILLDELNKKLKENGKTGEKSETATSDKVNEKTKITPQKKKKAGAARQMQLFDIEPGKPEPQPIDIVKKAKEIAKKDQEKRSPEKKKKTLSDYPLANKFVTEWQKPALRDMWGEHESVIRDVEKTLESMPERPQDKGMKSTVYAHYFMGATDIFVMDIEGDNAYAYVILNGDSQMSEAGTISLSEIANIPGMELDLYWTPKSLDEALYDVDSEYFPNPKKAEKIADIQDKSVSLKEKTDDVEPSKKEQHERERTKEQDGRRDNSRAESDRRGLPDSEQVGEQRTPAEDTRRDSQSRRGDIDVSGSQPGAGLREDLNKSYSNEEIHEIVSTVTDIVDGKVEITGEVTEEIKTIAERYIPGGIAKQGRGVLDEYYTDPKIVDAIRDILSKYFPQDKSIRVLEPSVGTGNFIQAVPTNKSDVVAFEINETTARIAKIFHPYIEVNVRSFETEFIDESGKKKPMPKKFDLVIGNPPYGEHRGLYKGLGEESDIAKYEDYFVKRSLDVLKDGGMLAMVLPSGWMNRHKKEKGYRIEAAYRLPEGAFESTKIGTDIVFLRKDSNYNPKENHDYFEKHPENILGEVKERKNRFGRTEEYVEGDIDTAIEQIKKNEAKRIAEELDIEPTTGNIEDIEGAIEETADETGAKNIVKATRPKKSTPSKPHKGGKIKITPDKLKYELKKNDEVIPAAQLFDNKFSEEEAEAFKDCDYQGKFKNPEKHKKHANYYKGDWVHDFYYAEGNIYEKLEQLEVDKPNMSAEQYEKQKKMLKDVLPEQKTIDNISISPNTVFVKNLIITTDRAIAGKETLKNLFFQFLSNLPSEAFGDSNVWEVRDYINNNQVYGSDKYRNRLVRERRKKAANDLFHKFIKEELTEAERKQIEYAFNREYNAVYRPDYSKVPMFSSINKNFRRKPLVLMEVQKAGIGRMTVKGVGLLAHEVGFGKTLSGVLAMHEAMTRGFVKKPIVIVPNDSILKQWVETIYESIPNATVNILGNLGVKYDLSDFSINDGEITIVTYSGFKTMGFNDNTYEELASEFEYITDELKSHKSNRDKEKEKAKKAETKGKMKRGASYNFENFGFDYMIFDEVHNANHIVGKVKLDRQEASDFRGQTQRTSDLGIKTWIASQYIQKKNNGRNVCLLSATPFTNKPLEYYSILSLIANSTLKRLGFYRIDQFFETFMEAENDIEIKADGSTVDKTSVRRFKNNGLFNQLLSEFIDIKGEEDNPDLVRPNRHNKEYKIAQNSLTEQTLDAAQELLSDNDTVLSGITQARLAAFSPYASYLCPKELTTYKEFVENSPKIYATVKLIEQNIKDNDKAGQVIYSEIGVDFFPMIRDYLVKESGLKEDEVMIITGATSNKERARIQNAFNKGDVKIIIGSPAIKEGMDLQRNTTDMYILSLPYNFTQLRQVEGRGWRQGNKWENIRINYMLTNDTVDVFMLQRLQVKQNLYNEAMRSGAESVDVGDINTEELKTALITDPHTRAQIETTIERKRLEEEKTKIAADLAFVLRKFEKYNELKRELERKEKEVKNYEEWAKENDFWEGAAGRAKAKLQSYANELQAEKQRLAEKGVNVDDIENQEKRALEQIKEIDKKIENLKEVQDLLVEKYIKENEEKARKKGETIDKFVSERAKENKTFYEKRKESDSVFLQGDLAKTYGSDKKARMRAADRSETQTGGTASVFDELKLRETQNRFDNPLNDTDKYYAAVELMEIAEKILNTGLRTVVVKGKREVAQVLRNYGLKEEYADFYDNYEDPIQGVYYKGVVILNSSDINTSGELFDTWIHEIMHDYIGKNKGELIPLLGNVPDEVFEEVLPESYAGLSDLDKLEELLSFLSERVVSSETLPDYDVVKNKIKPIIDKFLNKITDGRYKNNQNIQRERRAVETSYEDIGEGVRQTARTVEERAEAGKSGKDDSAGRYSREGISVEKEIEKSAPRFRSVSDVAEEAGSKMPEELRKEYDIKYDRFFTRFREAWEDAFLPVKDFLDLLRKNGVEIADYNDFYKQATHLQGKNDAQLKIFKDSYQHPITIAVNALEKEGFSYRDIENYVFAKHGIERNEYMRNAEIEQFDYNHPDATEEQREAFIDSLPDDYAGLTELVEELGMPAQEYIDSFEKKAGQTAINNLWGAINKATDWILEKQYHTGMINKETYDDLISRYQYYVPLRGHDKETAEDRWDYTPDMGTFFTAPLIRAKGRRSRAESPFAYIEQMAHSAITQGNKNTLKQTILRLAQKENGGLMSATKTWKVNIGTKENPIWVMQSAPYSEDLETYLENQRTFEKRMQELKEEGMAYQGRAKLNIGDLFIKPKQAEQHEIQVYQNGVSHTVYINANPAIAKAINGANRNEVSENMAAILNMTRQMAANFTTRNPLFVMTNLSRDYIYATTMLLAKETPKFALDFQRNIPVAMGALQRYERGKLDLTKQSDRFLYEYMINGGKTGFSHIFELNRVAKALEREAKKGGKKNLADHGRAIIDVIDSFNDVAENMTRLSVYITSRQKGRNITDAINDAKNITVNFNQKGAGSSMAKNGFEKFLFNVLAGKIRPLYLFSNAAIQGLSNIIKVASNHPTRMAAIVSSYALLGFISPMLAMMFGGDDGEDSYMKLTDWERQNNWCILLPNGSFLKIPLPQELRVFHRLGDNIYHAVTGRKDILQTLMDTMFSISDLLPMNPMGAADTSWAELSPDFIRPLAQIATNTNFMGSRIYNEWANKNMPGYLKARTNKKGEYYAPQFMVDWFMMIDHATGGDGVKKGIISLNPDITNHLLRGYFGGLYTLAEQSIGIVKETYNFTKTGEFNVKIRETPLKAFYADKNDLRIQSSGLASRYYKIAEEVAEARRRNKGYLEKVQKGEMGIDEYARKVQELDMQKANLLYEKIRAIKRIEAALKEMTPEEQKQAEEQIGNLMKEVAEMSN